MHNTSRASATEVLDNMANSKSSTRRCFFCHQVDVSEATSADICLCHRLLISLRLVIMLVRGCYFIRPWRRVRWWK